MLEVRLRPEDETTHVRVQSVGTDDEVEVAGLLMLEGDMDAIAALVDGGDAVAEDRFDVVLDSGVDCGRQVAACQAGEVMADQASKNVDSQIRFDLAARPHGADTLHFVTGVEDLRLDSDALRHLVPDAPEVDHVAAGAELRCLFDQCRGVTGAVQPMRERHAGHTRAADGDSHIKIPPPRRFGSFIRLCCVRCAA